MRDADGDGWTVAAAGTICSGATLPAGYRSAAGTGVDCNDADPATHRAWAVYHDGDGDGFGVGALTKLCAGDAVPAGYSALDTDCDDSSAARWAQLWYAYRDADFDTYTIASPGQLCTNGHLPRGYSNSGQGADCNDADPQVWRSQVYFPDGDGDGYGSGNEVALCIGAAPPEGYATRGDDCAPNDAAKFKPLPYQYRDVDGDRWTVAQSGSVCSGNELPKGYLTSANGLDCNDGDPAVHVGFDAYADSDGDGFGSGAVVRQCTDGTVPAGFSMRTGDCEPNDGARWQMFSYSFVDRDGDGWTTAGSGPALRRRQLAQAVPRRRARQRL